MPDLAPSDWQDEFSNEALRRLQSLVSESNKNFHRHHEPNTIKFENNVLDDDYAELALRGYASQAVSLQILRELRQLKEILVANTP